MPDDNASSRRLNRSNNDLAALVAAKVFYRHGNIFWGENIRRKDLVGKIAGSVNPNDGYRYVKCGKSRRCVAAHRVIFLMHHGYLPDVIDHVNRIRDDNRIENLRDAGTESNNQGNQSHQVGRSSKFKGVCWDKNRGKWAAYIKDSGRRVNLGRFDCELKAAGAYNRKASEIFGEFANLNDLDGHEKSQLKEICLDAGGIATESEMRIAKRLYDAGYRKVKDGNQEA